MSNLITCQDWTESGDLIEFAPTNDPRIVAVIKRDEDATFEQGLDGDAIVPTYLVNNVSASHIGGYEDDSALADRIIEARSQFRYAAGYRYNGLRTDVMVKADAMAARWAWIFHGTTFNRGTYGYNNGYEILVMNTPAFRAHVGLVGEYEQTRESAQATADGMTSEVSNIADGYVYGIGYASNPSRVLDDEPIDFEDGNWNVEIEVWGFIGEDYAKQCAGAFEAGTPDLEPMLELAL